MAIEVAIKKNMGSFQLDIAFAAAGKQIGILGASGCGKSLTLKCIAGIMEPDEGRIVINGKVLYDSEKHISLKPQVRKVGYLFQNYALFPTMTVEQNIAAGLVGKKEEKRKRVAQMIGKFHLSGLEKRYPGELSGGQQQRVALARIMAYEPEVILLDEPFSALDVYLRDQLQRELIEMLAGYPGSIILVTHNRDEVYRMSKELLVFHDGKLVRQDETKKVFLEPRNIPTARITGCKNIANITGNTENGIYVKNWDLELPFPGTLPDRIEAVGIRAHEFYTEKKETAEEICFSVKNPVITEDLFEYNVSFRRSEQAEKRIDWKISKYAWKYGKNNLPDEIYLDRRQILILRKTENEMN